LLIKRGAISFPRSFQNMGPLGAWLEEHASTDTRVEAQGNLF
jgi:hypothetical protein